MKGTRKVFNQLKPVDKNIASGVIFPFGKGHRKEFVGKVVSDKMNKSVVVAVERRFKHPLYGKVVKKTKKFMAHDEFNICKVGDKVKIREWKPISKRKRWVVVEIIERGEWFTHG